MADCKRWCVWVGIFLIIGGCQIKPPGTTVSQGEQVFKDSCAGCHDTPELTRAISQEAMEAMQANDIFVSLERGPMSFQGMLIQREQRIAVAEYLGKGKVAQEEVNRNLLPPSGYCKAQASSLKFQDRESGWNGWGAKIPGRAARRRRASVPRISED